MRWSALLVLPLQALLLGCAILMCSWVRLPWIVLAALGVCGLIACGTSVAAALGRQASRAWPLVVLWAGTLLVPVSLALSNRAARAWDSYFVAVAWLVAAALFATTFCMVEAELQRKWRRISVVWGFFGSLTWLFTGYSQNLPAAFYAGLVCCAAFLIASKFVFHLPTAAVLLVNTLVILAFVLPIGDQFLRPRHQLETNAEVAREYYSYSEAKKNPAAFARWWRHFGEQWQLLAKELYVRDPSGFLPFRLRPGAQYVMFQSRISINNQGFRGKEIAEDKGTAYRIVALGESTTFGCTLRADDTPWPEVLEQMIQERLRPSRRVEVINAGVPGWSLAHNVHRLSADILPLQPDMIISYHGINSFPLLDSSIPRATGPPPPRYQERPLKILADAEHGLKVLFYKRRLVSKHKTGSPKNSNLMANRFAQEYLDLLDAARTNGVKLVVGTFSMAVNARSDADVIEFYRSGFPAVYAQIRANEAHSALVRRLAAEHAEICFVDTQPNLDGEHEKFIDLMHLTQPGRQQLAEAFFKGIRGILEQQLLRTNEPPQQPGRTPSAAKLR